MASSKHRWPLWPWLVLTVAGLATTAVAAIVGTAASTDSEAAQATTRVTITATQFRTTTVTETITATPTPTNGPASALADGLHTVGVDVQAGKYATPGPSGANAGGCYWSRTDAGGGVIDNGVYRGPGTITVNTNEVVETAGCQPWNLMG